MGWDAYRQGHRPSWLTPKYLPLRQLNQVSARRQWKQARGPARRGWNTLLGTPRRGIKGEDRKVKEHGSSSGNGAGGCLRERSVVGEKATVTARRLFQKFPLLYQLLLRNQSSTVVSSSLEQCSLIDYLRGLARLIHTCAFTAGTVQGTAGAKIWRLEDKFDTRSAALDYIYHHNGSASRPLEPVPGNAYPHLSPVQWCSPGNHADGSSACTRPSSVGQQSSASSSSTPNAGLFRNLFRVD